MKEALQEFIVERVYPIASNSSLFNQYRDEEKGLDRRGGARIRRENLAGYLSCFSKRPRTLLVGEAPGPWGGRFSGVPFTGEGPLSRGELPFSGQQTSRSEVPYSERAGTVFWELLGRHHPDFFVWNTVPFHPHRPGEPLSIRTPKWNEVRLFLPLLEALIDILKPKQIAAIGRVAEKALTTIGRECVYVRHPSHGGVTRFREGMGEVFGV